MKAYKNYLRRKVNPYFSKRFPKPVFIHHKRPILLNITMWIQRRRKAGPSKVAPKMAKINSISGLLWTKQIYMGLLWTNMLSLAFLESLTCPLVDPCFKPI